MIISPTLMPMRKTIRRSSGFAALRLPRGQLDRHRTFESIYHAGELDQRPVTHKLDSAAAVFSDLWIDQLLALCAKLGKRARLIGRHQSAVANNISGKDCRKSPLDAFGRYCSFPLF